jgi:hypothetical protein
MTDAYRQGRNSMLTLYAIPTVLTAPVLFLFAVDPVGALLEGAMLWTCALVSVAVVHGATAFGLLIAVLRKQQDGDVSGAEGHIYGWIIGLAANGFLFWICALFFAIFAAITRSR